MKVVRTCEPSGGHALEVALLIPISSRRLDVSPSNEMIPVLTMEKFLHAVTTNNATGSIANLKAVIRSPLACHAISSVMFIRVTPKLDRRVATGSRRFRVIKYASHILWNPLKAGPQSLTEFIHKLTRDLHIKIRS